jgi:hypothetical protein
MLLSFHAIRSVEIGSISTRKLDAPCQLDSYQEEDLTELKCQWLELIDRQKDSLVSQVNLLNQQTGKERTYNPLKNDDNSKFFV